MNFTLPIIISALYFLIIYCRNDARRCLPNAMHHLTIEILKSDETKFMIL